MSKKSSVIVFRKQEIPYRELDKGIRRYVKILADEGVKTYESCEGGEGHSFQDPTIRFSGGYWEGIRALSIALAWYLPVSYLKRIYYMDDGELAGPEWEIVFSKKSDE